MEESTKKDQVKESAEKKDEKAVDSKKDKDVRFRCPYCKEVLSSLSSNKCPKCGHVMSVKNRTTVEERKAKRKKIERIRADAEMKKRELGGVPQIKRGPGYYGIVIGIMVLFLCIAFACSFNGTAGVDRRPMRAQEQVDALATALGRFHFHTGVYPDQTNGFVALTWIKTGCIKGYNGPYITNRYIGKDPWKRDWIYMAPPEDVPDALPLVMSLGADGMMGTEDDVIADTNCFYLAGRDTSWTNKWVPYKDRGMTIVPNREIQRKMMEERNAQ